MYVLNFYYHTHVKNENFVYLPTIFQGLTRIRYFSFLLRDIRAFSKKKEKNDMFRLPTELEYVLCWPCNMDVYLTCHFFLPKAYYVQGQFYQILPMTYRYKKNTFWFKTVSILLFTHEKLCLTLGNQQLLTLLIWFDYEWNFTKPGKMPLFNACIPA